jgi:hypothetical protein
VGFNCEWMSLTRILDGSEMGLEQPALPRVRAAPALALVFKKSRLVSMRV